MSELDLTPIGESISNVQASDGNYFTPSEPAKHSHAVLYQADFQSPADGTASAARAHAVALAATGIPLLLKPLSTKLVIGGVVEDMTSVGLPPEVSSQVGHLIETSASSLVPLIRHFVIYSGDQITRTLMRGVVAPGENLEFMRAARDSIYGQTILFSVWERTVIQPDVVSQLNRVAMNWVPCEHNRQILLKNGVSPDRVTVVPHPYDPSDPICLLRKRQKGRSYSGQSDLSDRRFYAIGRWEPRKGFPELIDAFLAVNCGDPRAHLTIKTHEVGWEGFPTVLEHQEAMCAKYELSPEEFRKRVTIIDRPVNRKGIVRLHFENNIYVCPSRGEAFCLPAFEAKLAGNRMIHVPWGGTTDFASPWDLQIEYDLLPVDKTYRWPEGSLWAVPRRHSLERCLSTACPPDDYSGDNDLSAFSSEKVGARMRESVSRVVDSLAFADIPAIRKGLGL